MKVADEGNRFCIVAVTLEVCPATQELYEQQQRQTKTQAAAAAVATTDATAQADLPPMPYKPGDKVEANYKGQGSYYRAAVKSVNKEDRTCALRYDDGDEEKTVPLDRIRAIPGAAAPVKSPVKSSVKSPVKSSANPVVDSSNNGGLSPGAGADAGAAVVASKQAKVVVVPPAAAVAAPAVAAAPSSNVPLPTSTPSSSGGGAGGGGGSKYSVGQKVDALFDRGEEWWPATVRGLSAAGTAPGKYNLLYDDGDVEDDVSVTRMRPGPGSAQGLGLATGGENSIGQVQVQGQSSFDNYLDGLSLDEDEGQGLAAGPAVYGNINSINTNDTTETSPPHTNSNHNSNSRSHPSQGSPMISKNNTPAPNTPSPTKQKGQGQGGNAITSVEGDSSYMEDFDP